MYFWTQFTIFDAEPEFDAYPWTIFTVLALAMTALEAIRVRKRWHDETVNKRVLVVKSLVIVFLPVLLFYLIFYITLPVFGMLGIYL